MEVREIGDEILKDQIVEDLRAIARTFLAFTVR